VNKNFWRIGTRYVELDLFEKGYPYVWGDGVTDWGYLDNLKECDFSINALSNLTLLNNEIIAEMKANRLSSVQVSLYSMDSDIHDSIAKLPGSFYTTRDAILKLRIFPDGKCSPKTR